MSPPAVNAGLDTADVRRAWPQVLDQVKQKRKFIWMITSQFAQVADVAEGDLWLSFVDAGSRDNFSRSQGEDIVRAAVLAVLGADMPVRVRLNSDPASPGTGGRERAGDPPPGTRQAPIGRSARTQRSTPSRPSRGTNTAPWPTPDEPPDDEAEPEDDAPGPLPGTRGDDDPGHGPSPDDPIVDSQVDEAEALVKEIFGAELVKEQELNQGKGS